MVCLVGNCKSNVKRHDIFFFGEGILVNIFSDFRVDVSIHAGYVRYEVDVGISTFRRDGLVGYDAALTQLRSRVQFPVFVVLTLLNLRV